MKSFDEYLREEIDARERMKKENPHSPWTDFLMGERGLAFEKFREDYLATKPDPLAEWKALQPGDKVLVVCQDGIHIYHGAFDSIYFNDDQIDRFILNHQDGRRITVYNPKHVQVLLSGPFDSSKVKVGDWVWVEGANEHISGWYRMSSISTDHVWVEGKAEYKFRRDGQS